MAVDINTNLDTWTDFTITLASLATGSARQSTMVSNTANFRPGAIVDLRIQSGAVAPTAGTLYELYLLRGDDSGNRTDNAGAVDAAITIENAQLLGTLVVTATVNKNFQDLFSTHVMGPLGTEWGIAVRNDTGQALNATEANHIKRFATYRPRTNP